MAISPWDFGGTKANSRGYLKLSSPDKKQVAEFYNLQEFAMGSPTHGNLKINGFEFHNLFSPSAVWDENSSYFAVPMWVDYSFGKPKGQKLCVYKLESREIYFSDADFRVLVLHKFNEAGIHGSDGEVEFVKKLDEIIKT